MQCNQLLGNKVIATYSDYCKRTRRESLNRSIESKPNVLLTVQGSSESNYLGFKCAKDVWFQSSVNHPAAQVSIHTSEVSLGHWMQKNLMRRRTLITFSEIPLSIMTSPPDVSPSERRKSSASNELQISALSHLLRLLACCQLSLILLLFFLLSQPM